MTKIKRAHEQTTAAIQHGWVEGSSFFGSIIAGTLLGWLGDHWLGTDPWLIVTGIVAGSVTGFYRMWAMVRIPTGKEPRDAS